MRRTLVLAALLTLTCTVNAADLSPADKTFFDQHISDVVKIEPTLIDAPAVQTVFAVPFYNVTIEIKEGDGNQTQQLVLVRMGDHLASATRPSSDAELPDFPKMIKPSFKLKTDDDAKALQSALDATCPIVGDDDKKAEKFTHNGNEWHFIRGKFFDKQLGYILTTNDDGAITSAKFTLQLP
jgi:hypothetical protein